jgi:hypothetical protein
MVLIHQPKHNRHASLPNDLQHYKYFVPIVLHHHRQPGPFSCNRSIPMSSSGMPNHFFVPLGKQDERYLSLVVIIPISVLVGTCPSNFSVPYSKFYVVKIKWLLLTQ